MYKNAFANIEAQQEEMLKRARAMKELKEVLITTYLPNVMYDNKTDSQVFMAKCKSSTLNRYKILVTKLLKYADDEHHDALRKKIKEIDTLMAKALAKEEAEAIAKRKEASRKYWAKQAKLGIYPNNKKKQTENTNTAVDNTNTNTEVEVKQTYTQEYNPSPIKKMLPSTATTQGNSIEFKFDKYDQSVNIKKINADDFSIDIYLDDEDSIKDVRSMLFSAGYGNGVRKLVDAIIIECSRECKIYTNIKEPTGVTVDLYPWRKK